MLNLTRFLRSRRTDDVQIAGKFVDYSTGGRFMLLTLDLVSSEVVGHAQLSSFRHHALFQSQFRYVYMHIHMDI